MCKKKLHAKTEKRFKSTNRAFRQHRVFNCGHRQCPFSKVSKLQAQKIFKLYKY